MEGEPHVTARMDRMEAVMRDIETRQHELQSGQKAFLWGTGILATFVAAVIGGLIILDLSRIFQLGDRLADVQNQAGELTTGMDYLREDVAEIKKSVAGISRLETDLTQLRGDLERVAEAVGAERAPPPKEERTQLVPH